MAREDATDLMSANPTTGNEARQRDGFGGVEVTALDRGRES